MPAETLILTIEDAKRRFARLVEADAKEAVAERGSFSIAIPGGSAATLLLPGLVESAVEWGRIEVFWVDERRVPADHADSNARAAREAWLSRVPIPERAIHTMSGEPSAYEEVLRELLGDPPRLDLALVGVGEDGHIASLFPGHPLLIERARSVAALDDAPKPPPRRLTLTLPTITQARRLVVFAAGEGKAGAIREAVTDPASPLPLALALRATTSAVVLLDPGAASGLPGR